MSDKTSLYIVSIVAVVGIVAIVFMMQQQPDVPYKTSDVNTGEMEQLPEPPKMFMKGEGPNATPVVVNDSKNVVGQSINIYHDNCNLVDYHILRDGVMYVYDCGAGGIGTYTIETR